MDFIPKITDGVIVISCGDETAENVIQKILGIDVLSSVAENDGIKVHEWRIETKYYSAVVNLYAIHDKKDIENKLCETIQATVFYFNGKEPTSFENVLNWMPFLKEVNSEVQLLVCEDCNNDSTHKKTILDWCVKNQFELIELSSQEESDDEDEQIFSKLKGYGRVIEALQSHTWSSLVMKNVAKQSHDLLNCESEASAQSGTVSSCSSQKVINCPKTVKVGDEEVLLEDQWLQKVIDQDDPEEESFEALFAKFASMKEKAAGLTGEERKKYAEQVAIAFCKAMGCEEDEVEGLEDYPS